MVGGVARRSSVTRTAWNWCAPSPSFIATRRLAITTAPGESGDEGKGNEWIKEMRQALFGDGGVSGKRTSLVQTLLFWLLRRQPQDDAPDLLLRAAETTGALGDKLCPTGWRETGRLTGWVTFAGWHKSQYPAAWTPEHRRRWWRLVHWMDQPHAKADRMRPTLEVLLDALDAGEANEADLLDQLIGPRPQTRYGNAGFAELGLLSGRRPAPVLETHPALRTAMERVVARVLDVELTRGELPTAASAPALALRSAGRHRRSGSPAARPGDGGLLAGPILQLAFGGQPDQRHGLFPPRPHLLPRPRRHARRVRPARRGGQDRAEAPDRTGRLRAAVGGLRPARPGLAGVRRGHLVAARPHQGRPMVRGQGNSGTVDRAGRRADAAVGAEPARRRGGRGLVRPGPRRPGAGALGAGGRGRQVRLRRRRAQARPDSSPTPCWAAWTCPR